MPLIAHAWIVAPLLLVAGALIGATGIGGVLVVPLLTTLGGIVAPQAIAASSLAFFLPALVALGPLRQRPELARRCVPLLAGALGGAVVGALVVRWLPVQVLLAGVTALVLLAGWRGLRPSAGASAASAPMLGAAPLTALGAVVGLGSALTGTGGPVLLLPLLMLLRQPLVFAVAAAQAVQLPVAISASTVHALAGRLDWRLALMCGLLLMIGSLAGQRAARRLPVAQLQRAVAVLLLATGGWFAVLILK